MLEQAHACCRKTLPIYMNVQELHGPPAPELRLSKAQRTLRH